jgi:hypothetical protein
MGHGNGYGYVQVHVYVHDARLVQLFIILALKYYVMSVFNAAFVE